MANKPPFTSWSELNREDTSAWRKFISALVRSGLFPSGGGTGTITPGDTVQSQTSFGLSSTAGTSPDYSRKDHAHGTPADPGTGGGSGDGRLVNDGRLERISDTSLQWVGYELGLYDVAAVAWIGRKPTSLTLANTANDLDGNALTYDAQYDIYAEGTDGSTTTVALQAKKFSSGNTRSVTPELFEGRYVYDADTDAGKRRLWLGTIRLRNDGGTAKFTDTGAAQFVSNYYNPQSRYGSIVMSGNQWTYGSTTLRAANNDTANKVEAVFCQSTQVRIVGKHFFAQGDVGTNTGAITEIGIDSTTTGSATEKTNTTGSGLLVQANPAAYQGSVDAGYHAFYVLEKADAAHNVTFASYGFGWLAQGYIG